MLTLLSIKNYALIDELSIDFGKGFSVMTGETGAGKSIILGALGLILGQRADLSVLRDKSSKCTVEGTFQIDKYGLDSFFEEHELDYEPSTILRREISPSGKSRAFINDTPVTLDVIRAMGLRLVDIHSQHQNLDLNKKTFQLRLIDMVAGNDELLANYSSAYNDYLGLNKKLEETTERASKSKADLDYYQFQFNQLEEARLVDGEQEDLENVREKLNRAEDIQMIFGKIADSLDGSELNVLSSLKDNMNQLSSLKSIMPEAEELYKRLESCYLELKDIASESYSIADATENDPEKASMVGERLDLIYSLQQKHRVNSVKELHDIQNDLDQRILLAGSYEDEINLLKKKISESDDELNIKAHQLRKNRASVVDLVQKKVVEVLISLGIPNASFKIHMNELKNLTPSGLDEVSFLFSANKNQELQEISKIASGGEISRLMLAVKTLITDAKALPTIVLDEIDAGISGEIAVKMGLILKQLASSIQVINITHLPQIAGRGEHHYLVYKYDDQEKTYTSIRKMNIEERIEELAKMLSGDNYSETSLKTAKELLQ